MSNIDALLDCDVKGCTECSHSTLLNELRDGCDWLFIGIHDVGSRVTCDPAPSDTDDDKLVYVSKLEPAIQRVQQCGFAASSPESMMQQPMFASVRRLSVNLIMTDSHEFLRRFLLATATSKKLNLLNKQDRVTLFQAILYSKCDGVSWS